MKSYSEYTREQRVKQQKKIDSMKPLDRMDYMNRFDRIKERTNSYVSFIFFISLIKIGLGTLLFSMFLICMETETAILVALNLLILSKYVAFAALCMYPLMIIEALFMRRARNKYLNELDKKYNL